MSSMPAASGVSQLPLFGVGQPRAAGLRSLDVHAIAIPARAFTGDFYFVQRVGDRFWFALGDVAGKGLSAAVVMAMIQEELERTTCDDPAANMMRLHTFLRPLLPRNRFATAVLGYISEDGTLKMANAGHCPPLIARDDGTIEPVVPTGPVVGVLSSSQWSTFETRLERDEALVLYSDGVIEARSADDEDFGMGRLAAAVNGDTAEKIASEILDAVKRHGEPTDDLTLLVIRR